MVVRSLVVIKIIFSRLFRYVSSILGNSMNSFMVLKSYNFVQVFLKYIPNIQLTTQMYQTTHTKYTHSHTHSPPASLAPKDNQSRSKFKSNTFRNERENQILSRQESSLLLDYNFQLRVNIEISNRVFNQTRYYNGEM